MTVRYSWQALKQRCTNPNNPHWDNYGGRGIEVRFASFEEFYAEVGERPPGLTIDRIDNDGHYERGNLRWATRSEQQLNRRNAVFVEIDGKKHRLHELTKKSGIPRTTIFDRAARGLSMTEVLSPERKHDLSGLALGGQASGAKRRKQSHCCRGHKFTKRNTYITPQGWRQCRACHAAKMQRRAAAKKREE
jgi:hypothetical protein